jgi:AbiV family abortive infection protein
MPNEMNLNQVRFGAVATAYNVQRLVRDSLVLLENKKGDYGSIFSSFSLLAIAFQEMGKILLLKGYFSSGKRISSDEYHNGPFGNHEKKVETALDYCNHFQFWWGRGFPPWHGNVKIEMLRGVALYADYDFQDSTWKMASIATPNGQVSPRLVFMGQKNSKRIVEFMESKEYQVLVSLCRTMVMLIGLSLMRLRRTNPKLFSGFRLDADLFRSATHANVKMRSWNKSPLQRLLITIAIGKYKAMIERNGSDQTMFPHVDVNDFIRELLTVSKFDTKSAKATLKVLTEGVSGFRLRRQNNHLFLI